VPLSLHTVQFSPHSPHSPHSSRVPVAPLCKRSWIAGCARVRARRRDDGPIRAALYVSLYVSIRTLGEMDGIDKHRARQAGGRRAGRVAEMASHPFVGKKFDEKYRSEPSDRVLAAISNLLRR
jgi:hypothetical protein